MKINRYSQIINQDIYKANKEVKPTEKEKTVDSGLNIQISNSAKELVQMIKGNNSTEFSEKVEKIRQSIIDGNYKVDSEEIAKGIIKAMKVQKGSEE